MKTICYLADASNPHTIKWCNYFKNKGYNIHVISLNQGDIDGVNVHNFSFNVKELKNESPFKKIKYLSVIGKIKKLVNQIKPDILHAHYASSYGLIGSLLNYHPYIISVWGSDIYDFPNGGFIQKSIIRYNLKKADYIFSTSEDMARETKKYTNKEISITPFGIDMEFFSPNKKDKQKDIFTVGTIKTLEKKYGIDYLIKGFKLAKDEIDKDKTLENKNIVLKIAGSGSQESNLIALVQELNLNDCVEFLGRLELNRVAYNFNKFDISVFASLRESFGVSALESQSCGVPVIVTDVGGHPEVVLNNKTGIIVKSEDEKEIKKAILKLFYNKELRNSMSCKAREFVKQNYEINSNFSDIQKIYKDILSK